MRTVRDRRAKPKTIGEMVSAWLSHCHRTYPSRDGAGTLANMRSATRQLVELFGDAQLRDFSIDHMEAVQQRLIDIGRGRRTINDYMARIRTMMRHYQTCLPCKVSDLKVGGLRKGRSKAKETIKKRAVPVLDLLRTLADPKLNSVLKDVVRVSLRTGMRPGECLGLLGSELDTSESPWVYTPAQWKGGWLDKDRVIAIGPRAQLILLPYLNDSYLFTLNCGQRKGQPWRLRAYANAIRKSCLRMNVPHWTPQQIRKRALTDAAKRGGKDLAKDIAQHSDVTVTERHYLDPVLPQPVILDSQQHG